MPDVGIFALGFNSSLLVSVWFNLQKTESVRDREGLFCEGGLKKRERERILQPE